MTDCKNCNYTDEYCASGDCTSQLPRNHLATTSQVSDLTEQWKKGELEKCKDYYVKYGDYEMSLTLDGDNDFIFYGRPIKPEVLAEVPSYEEWKEKLRALDAAYETIKMEDETINRLVRSGKQCNYENAQLKEQINHLSKTQARQFVDNQKLQIKAEKAKDVVNIDTARQIKQLKEVLKECKEVIKNVDTYYGNYDATNGYLVIKKIDEVLRCGNIK